MYTTEDMIREITDGDIEFLRLQFTDAFGHLKNIAVTTSQLERIIQHQFSFEGDAMFDRLYPFDENLYLYPDVATFTILPWRPQQRRVAKVLCDICHEDGSLFSMSPRTILKRTIAIAETEGYRFAIRPSCEFYLFHLDEDGRPTTLTHEGAGYLDVGPLDYGENARRDIVLALEEMGLTVEASYHESSPGQHKIELGCADPLQAADALASFRFTVRSIAKRAGLHATFMPKPLVHSAGSGMHMNITIQKESVTTSSVDRAEQPSEIHYFQGGIEQHMHAMCAITNPTVNSYKRLLTYGGRVPIVRSQVRGKETTVEFRLPDAAANPYLVISLTIIAGLNGIQKHIEPKSDVPCPSLPTHLGEALMSIVQDDVLFASLGHDFMDIYTRIKTAEWKNYLVDVSPWEHAQYLSKI